MANSLVSDFLPRPPLLYAASLALTVVAFERREIGGGQDLFRLLRTLRSGSTPDG